MMWGWLVAWVLGTPAGPGDLAGNVASVERNGDSAMVFREGERLIAATREGGGRVTLAYDDGRVVHARVGDAVIAALEPHRAEGLELEVIRTLSRHLGLVLARSTRPREDALALTARLQRGGLVEVMPDLWLARRVTTFEPPADDPRRGGQWFLDVIGIDAAWAHAVGSPDTVIGVVDNGCDLTHPDLAAKMLPGRDLVDGDDDPSFAPRDAGNEHGTACAGLIAAVSDNGEGIAGVCPECTLRCVRLLGSGGGAGGVEVPMSADVEAFDLQREWGVAVSSNSWGFIERVPAPWPLRNALIALIGQGRGGLGAVVVFAAGNDAREIFEDELYGIDGLVTVGAINAFDEAAQFSNKGDVVDLVAPAGSLTTDIAGRDGASDDDYTGLFGGTSSACPVVAGVAGLLASAAPERTGRELVDALVGSARPAPFALPDEGGHDPLYGYGIVDPLAALTKLGVVEVEPSPEPGPEVSAEVVEAVEADAEAEVDIAADVAERGQARDEGCAGGGATWLGLLALIARFSRFRVARQL